MSRENEDHVHYDKERWAQIVELMEKEGITIPEDYPLSRRRLLFGAAAILGGALAPLTGIRLGDTRENDNGATSNSGDSIQIVPKAVPTPEASPIVPHSTEVLELTQSPTQDIYVSTPIATPDALRPEDL